jgi:probable O-glycosylation ligase (exosortase A-associated)
VPLRDLLVLGILFASIPFVLRRPFYGILLWSWIGYMNPHRLCWGIAYTFPVAQVAAIALMAGLVMKTKDWKAPPVTPITVAWWSLIAWMGVTTLFAFFPESAEFQYIKVLKIQLVILFTLMVMRTREEVDLLIWIIAMSIGYYGVKGGIHVLTGGGGGRVFGPSGTFIADANSLGTALLMTVPLMRYLHLRSRKVWQRWGLLGAMALSVVAAVGTHSRGALLALLAMLGFLWLKSRGKLVTGIVSVLGLVLVVSFMPPKWMDRMRSIQTYEEDGSAMGRINAWHYAINLANHRFTGGGFEAWKSRTFAQYAPDPDKVNAAHSIWFGVLGDHGWVGLGLFASIFMMAWMLASRIARLSRGLEELEWAGQLARMIQVSLVAYWVGGTFLSLSYFDLPWHLVVVLITVSTIVRRTQEQLSNEPKVSGATRAKTSQVSARVG